MNTYTNTDTSRTPCSIIKQCCKLKGFMCEYANENGYCKLTACAYPVVLYRDSTIVKTRILKEREIGEWIYKENELDPELGGEYLCSHCGSRAEVDLYGDWILSNFCPSCGVLMQRKEKKDER